VVTGDELGAIVVVGAWISMTTSGFTVVVVVAGDADPVTVFEAGL
jgi:hypothetical protein